MTVLRPSGRRAADRERTWPTTRPRATQPQAAEARRPDRWRVARRLAHGDREVRRRRSCSGPSPKKELPLDG